MILATTIIWGAAFAFQRMGAGLIGPFTFIATRFFIGGLVTMAVAPFFARRAKDMVYTGFGSIFNRKTIFAGAICGVVLFIASVLQQVWLADTTSDAAASKAGFLTSLYVVFVPLLGLFLRRRPSKFVWLGVIIAVAGIYLLTVTDDLQFMAFDLLLLTCALLFAVHIMFIDHFAPGHDNIALSSVQFFTVAFFAFIGMLVFETPTLAELQAAAIPLLYTGLLSSGVAYTLQTKAQKITAPAVAAVLFSTEAVFAAVFGFIILREILTVQEIIGCILVFIAVVISQVSPRSRKEQVR
ncbi:MAG: DMT family transporter [Defluviitaleaceae bacterium]|nr:DMT family transporter [Defluviitaleaceae bacterium]